MLIVSYDISNNKLRTQFSKFLSRFGYRLQYSMFEIKNSDRILHIVLSSIEKDFSKRFCESDSIIILKLSKQCKKYTYGYAAHADDEVVFIQNF